MSETIWAPKINVFGMVLRRADDGSYIGNVAREESVAGIFQRTPPKDSIPEVIQRVKWDVRVSQDWLRSNPNAWVPA